MNKRLLVAMLSAGTSLLALTAAMAQDAEANDTDAGGVTNLGEIVIYGDRNADTLADTTASVGVVGQEDLSSTTNKTFRDAFARVANASAGHQTEAGFVLRGVNSEGQTPGAFGTPLASFYIDGVQQTVEATRRGARGLFDMEQLEIYRGPQSTLSGRAALAGAIYLRSVEPEFKNSGKVQLTYGEDNHRQVGVAVNMSHSDDLAFRISGEWSEKDSDLSYPSYEQYDLFDDFQSDDYKQFRARMLWTPGGDDSTRVLLSYAHSQNSPYYNDVGGPGRSTFLTTPTAYGEMRGDIYGTLSATNAFGMPQPFLQDLRSTKTDSVGLEVTHDISDVLTFTSMTGWNRSVTDRKSINTGSSFDPFTNIWDGFTNQTEFDDAIFSQELRLNYETDQLRWVAGAYAGREKSKSSGALDFSALQQLGPFAPALLGVENFSGNATTSNLALFGEVAYEVIPSVTVIAGGRLDYFKRETDATSIASGRDAVGEAVLGANGTSSSTSSFEDTVFIPKVGLQYEIDATQSIAFVYQQGYRPGGGGLRLSDGAAYEFDAEKAHNYELSYRGSFMNDRLTVAAAAFYNDWSNQQVEIWATPGDSSSSYIANAGKSHSYGAELEVSYAAREDLNLFASVGLLQSEFEDFVVGANDYSGQAFPNSSKQNLSFGYRYGADRGWFSTGVVTMTGKRTGSLGSGVVGHGLDAYTVVDIEAGYVWDNGVTVTAYANNLFDTSYLRNEYGPGSQATLGGRREVGLQLEYTF